jgi:hypothetical protein
MGFGETDESALTWLLLVDAAALKAADAAKGLHLL